MVEPLSIISVFRRQPFTNLGMVIAASPQVNSLETFLVARPSSYNSPVISRRVINMAFPGIISRLHSDPDSLPVSSPRVCRPGPKRSGCHGHAGDAATDAGGPSRTAAASILKARRRFPCAATTASWRKRHPGTGQWSHDDAGQGEGDGGIVPEESLAEMAQWLEAGHRHFICSTVQPVARAILKHLASRSLPRPSLLAQFHTLLCEATEADYLAVLSVGAGDATLRHAWAEAYMKLEKKLHRAYLDH